MLFIYTNENNPATLKLLIAANLSKVEVSLKVVNPNDSSIKEPKHLPYLQVDDDNILFIPNAASCYLLPPHKSQESLINEWLEFEATLLAPYVAQVIGNSGRYDKLKAMLQVSIRTINNAVSGKQFMSGDSPGLCDIVLWSTLYPLYTDQNLCKEYLMEHTNLLCYLSNLEQLSEFKDAITTFKVSGAAAYSALCSGARYPIPTDAPVEVNTPTSPQHSVDAVTSNELNAAREAWLNGKKILPSKKVEMNPVLPIPGEKNILITSALPYVNNVPHLGNIIGCVLSSDVFARFCRLCNINTLLIGGTDEYGTATETKAMEENLTPQQICDKYFEIHNSIYRWFNIGFDYFGRTTTPEQTKRTQELFNVVNRNGFMFTEAVEQLLCENCDRYLADRFVEGLCPHVGCNYEDARGDQCDGCGKLVNAAELKNPRCKMCGKAPVTRSSKQFFLDLPKLEPLLLHWIAKSSPGWSNNARIITNSWMKEGLKPRCITRDLKWGIPVPLEEFKDKVFYVWFDAPIGYISMTQKYTKEWQKWWQPTKDTNVSLYQFMAKDNVPFHSVMFPATLLGANENYVTVSHIMATEYLNYEDGKFSKSRGVGVFGNDAQNTGIPSDVWRFYLLYVRPENQDSSFSWVDLATKNNSELLNNLGNFVNRALVFAEKNFSSTVPHMRLTVEDYTLLALCARELKAYVASLEKAKLRDGIRHILSISRHGNQYMQSTQPWVLLKGDVQQKERAGTVIGVCANLVCLLATLLYPYMPETSRTIKSQLNAPDDTSILCPENPVVVNLLTSGHQLGKPAPLFSKIEPAQVEAMKKKFAGKQQTENTTSEQNAGDVVSIEEEIAHQADKVRVLKSSGAAKNIWQPAVDLLLELKKKLLAAKTSVSSIKTEALNITAIEAEVAMQADKVRILKSKGVEKSVWQPEVKVLLDLKKKLESAKKSIKTSQAPDVASIEAEVAKQADKVRVLKSNSEKKVGQPEITVSLELKKKLQDAQSAPAQVAAPAAQNGTVNAAEVKILEEEVDKQSQLVRKLKEGGSPKTEWQPQVDVLLQLKGKLAVALGKPVNQGKGKKGKK